MGSAAAIVRGVVGELDGDDLRVGLVVSQDALAGEGVAVAVAEALVGVDVGQAEIEQTDAALHVERAHAHGAVGHEQGRHVGVLGAPVEAETRKGVDLESQGREAPPHLLGDGKASRPGVGLFRNRQHVLEVASVGRLLAAGIVVEVPGDRPGRAAPSLGAQAPGLHPVVAGDPVGQAVAQRAVVEPLGVPVRRQDRRVVGVHPLPVGVVPVRLPRPPEEHPVGLDARHLGDLDVRAGPPTPALGLLGAGRRRPEGADGDEGRQEGPSWAAAPRAVCGESH